MVETTIVSRWKRDKGIVPGEASQIAKFRAKQADKEFKDNGA